MKFICDQCGNITYNETSQCTCCGNYWISNFSKYEVVCSKCNVIIQDGWSCKYFDGDIYCLHCDY